MKGGGSRLASVTSVALIRVVCEVIWACWDIREKLADGVAGDVLEDALELYEKMKGTNLVDNAKNCGQPWGKRSLAVTLIGTLNLSQELSVFHFE
ncbi:hypothetical protein BYT27DRAFT_6342027 [Phlegmacium glaucopus]|nr:hypothetical protein BYT27DRAFT_6342027 [Phlegmacium glaucopus]